LKKYFVKIKKLKTFFEEAIKNAVIAYGKQKKAHAETFDMGQKSNQNRNNGW
jgi:hypothetical protein